MQIAKSPGDEGRACLEAVLEQAHDAPLEDLGIDGARRRDDALDLGRELGLWPQHAVDPELLETGHASRRIDEIASRHEADGLGVSKPIGHGARDDVDFVETRAGDEELRLSDVSPFEDLFARAAAEHELHVHRREHVGDVGVLVDDDHFVIVVERTGERRPHLAATDDHDAHDAAAGGVCTCTFRFVTITAPCHRVESARVTPCAHTRRTGRSRTRLPVAAKIALQMAGAIGGTPGSPTPAGGASLATMCTRVLSGASFMRATS